MAWLGEVSPAGRRALLAAFAGWTLDAMDFVLYLLAIPALRAEFGLDARQAGLLATVALLSSAVGGVAAGTLELRPAPPIEAHERPDDDGPNTRCSLDERRTHG